MYVVFLFVITENYVQNILFIVATTYCFQMMKFSPYDFDTVIRDRDYYVIFFFFSYVCIAIEFKTICYNYN